MEEWSSLLGRLRTPRVAMTGPSLIVHSGRKGSPVAAASSLASLSLQPKEL